MVACLIQHFWLYFDGTILANNAGLQIRSSLALSVIKDGNSNQTHVSLKREHNPDALVLEQYRMCNVE